MLPLNKPEVFVSAAHQKVDAQGRLTDEPSRTALRALLEALSVWTRRLRSS
jgi:chromate reductase